MRTSTKLFIFAAGAAFGSLFTYFTTKKYFEDLANEEIESMREWAARKALEYKKAAGQTPDPKADVDTEPTEKKFTIKDYTSMVNDLGYYDYSNSNPVPEEREEDDIDLDDYIYIIKPEVFGEEDGYEEVSLTYYADGVLCDEQDNPIEDVTSMVPSDFASYYGYYERDAVYARNELLKTDYEILADLRKYSDLCESDPHLMEDE